MGNQDSPVLNKTFSNNPPVWYSHKGKGAIAAITHATNATAFGPSPGCKKTCAYRFRQGTLRVYLSKTFAKLQRLHTTRVAVLT